MAKIVDEHGNEFETQEEKFWFEEFTQVEASRKTFLNRWLRSLLDLSIAKNLILELEEKLRDS